MIVGIFATWDLSFFDQPENVLKRQLQANPTHPFSEIEPGVFMLTVRSQRILVDVLLCIMTVAVTAIMYGVMESTFDYLIVCIVVFLGFFKAAVYHRKTKTFVLDGNNKMYEFYKGDKLHYRGHYHNIYIRLKGQNSGGGSIYYNIILNGFQCDEESLTSHTTHHTRIFKLARKLAHKLDINFFDYQDKSRQHVIRHRCPYDNSCLLDGTSSCRLV